MSIGDILVKLGQQKALSQNELNDLHQWGELTQNNNQIIPGWLKPGSTDPFPDKIRAREAIFDVLKIYKGATQTGEIDGDLFLGEDLTDPAKATFHVFSTDQTYNGESMGAGDVMLGDNSATKPNLFYDASTAKLQMRTGTTVNAELGTSRGFSNIGAAARTNAAAATSVNNDTLTYLPLYTEYYDDASFWEGVTNPTRFTCAIAGTYTFTSWAAFNPDADGYRASFFHVNRTTLYSGAVTGNAGAATQTIIPAIREIVIAANDYVELALQHTAGAALDCSGFMAVRRIR